MENEKIIIGITHGDINGIGYEVILKTLAEPKVTESFIPVIYGSAKVAAYHRKSGDIQGVNMNIINNIDEINPKRINIVNCINDEIKVELGKATEEAGKAAFDALEQATSDLKKGRIQAIVTAPINKKNIQSDKFSFPGHTEYLEEKFSMGTPALMILMNDVMRVAVVTGHIPVSEVPKAISKELILQKIEVLNYSLKRDFKITRPRIAVLGLNPHAGDEGVIGNEESTIIEPAIAEAVKKGITCVGPYPADGFFGSGNFKKFDAILAMYHDQGLIPFKTIAMESGVNYTAGLNIIRTSPAHGTAYEIAGKNMASEESFRQAVFAAIDIYKNRQWSDEIAMNPLKIEPKTDRAGKIE
ncbi:MAG: 4-hydroxythreonine-4-phosphate dehydrogenase PdxA [Paludibacteraceae bacterium]|nr:4-hydroxythreonine-4-phosphate dehydrogenase PdxA [Paludibacteraceae bacterium]